MQMALRIFVFVAPSFSRKVRPWAFGSGVQGCYDCFGVLCNDGQESTGRRFPGSAASFPMFYGVEAETERVGKPSLCHVQPFADAFNINL